MNMSLVDISKLKVGFCIP